MDVTLCANSQCYQREKCYRFTATPDHKQQSYAKFLPDQRGYCGFFKPKVRGE